MSDAAPNPEVVPPADGTAAPPRPEPFSEEELRRALRLPAQLMEMVLGSPARIGAAVDSGRGLPGLVRLLLLASVACAVPYGIMLGLSASWRIPVLYLGSTLICLPSLHVFSTYLGLRVAPLQSIVLALTIPAVAATFCFGFAPIVGFLRLTMDEAAGHLSWRQASNLLLVLALAAGVLQLCRCVMATATTAPARSNAVSGSARPGAAGSVANPVGRFREPAYLGLLVVWLVVFLYVLSRMGTVLALFG